MPFVQDDIIAAFDAEAGDIASLADDDIKTLWFNQGMPRLPIRPVKRDDVDWVAGDTTIDLPADFYALRRIHYHPDNVGADRFEVLGTDTTTAMLIPYGDSVFTGAQAAGSGIIEYEAEWGSVDPDTANDPSPLPARANVACVYYALHRFYRKLGSNRAYYKRYSTLTGANAVSMSDLQAEADRYLQDFTDACSELTLGQPVSYYGG